MAVTSGTVHSVHIVKAPGQVDSLGLALVLFTISGTYAQADDSILTGVAALIEDSVRHGKTVTMLAVAEGQHTFNASSGVAIGIKTAAISTADVTFALTLSSTAEYSTTEFTNATAIPTLSGVLGFYVVYSEA